MVVLDKYNFVSEKIPISVVISMKPEEFSPVYEISIASISPNTEVILEKIRKELIKQTNLGIADITDPNKAEAIRNRFEQTTIYLVNKYFPDITQETINFFTTYIMQKSFGLGKIEILLDDEKLEEIVINSAKEPVWVYHHKHGWLKTNVLLESEEQIRHFSNLIARKVGRAITTLAPLLDANLSTGDRVNATLSPISSAGNTITLRKFATKPITITNMINTKVLSAEAAGLIWECIQYELSALIAGGTASGKTSILNAVAGLLPPNQRIISVEDTRELQLPKFLHWVPMVTRQPNTEGKGEIQMLDLIVNSLRMRPDRIIVGEIRRKREAEVLFEAMHTGHSVYATLHANDTNETITRLTNPPIDIPKTLLPAISLIMIMYRNRRTGMRRILQLSEILPNADGKVLLQLDMKSDRLIAANKSIAIYPTLQMQTGMTESEINQGIKEKADVLRWLAKKNIDSVDGVGKVVGSYYTNRENLLKFIGKNV